MSPRLLALLPLALAACAGNGHRLVGPVPAASVTLSRDTATVRAGESLQLVATVRDAAGSVLADRPVAWSSSDTAVATAGGGTVRARSAGPALIVARSEAHADTLRLTVRPRAEARALWVNRFEYGSAAGIAAIMDKARRANFNIVYFQVRGAGDAYYRSALEPCAVSLCVRLGGTPTWDPLEVAVREAHARGLELHAWVNALAGWSAGSAASCGQLQESDPGNPRHVLLQHPEWRVVDDAGAPHACPNGEEYVYLSPGVPAVRTHLARVVADIVRRYAVDGVHLDRIRYPGTRWSYDDASLAAFGRDPAGGAAAWAQFRRDQVSLAVRETFDSVMAVRATVTLSAAVWGIRTDRWGWNSSQGYAHYFQDPDVWARDRYLDVAAPMTYYAVHAQYCGFADWLCLLDDHLERLQASAGRLVYIGVAASKGAAEVSRQIELGRQRGARGFAIYSYNAVESGGLWSVLAEGAFQDVAEVP